MLRPRCRGGAAHLSAETELLGASGSNTKHGRYLDLRPQQERRQRQQQQNPWPPAAPPRIADRLLLLLLRQAPTPTLGSTPDACTFGKQLILATFNTPKELLF
jgi:hypothetical protein